MASRRAGPFGPAGSTLIEVLVATLVLVSGVLATAQLFLVAAATNAAARHATMSATIAAQKLEQLRSEATLLPSPSDALDRNTSGYVDHVNGSGKVVGEGGSPPPAAVYTRRWSVEALASNPSTIVIRVVAGRTDGTGKLIRKLGEAQLLTMKPQGPS
jgi:hypothetical protein